MLVDHVGALFFQGEPLFRLVGRLSFPIFAFLIAEGGKRTSNHPRYVQRLIWLAVISQGPFLLAFPKGDASLNVVYTLALGAIISRLHGRKVVLGVAGAAAIAELSHMDYGAGGILMIYGFTQLRMLPGFVCGGVALAGREGVNAYFCGRGAVGDFLVESFAVLSVAVVWLYDESPGWKGRRFFYSFYPLHLCILLLIRFMFEWLQ